MAKRKLPRTKTVCFGKLWTNDDVGQLIAWLDHCVKHEVDFRETIATHLKQSRGKDFGLSQVERKLQTMRERQLSAPYSIDYKPKWTDVFTKGSDVLGILDEEKSPLAQAKANLDDRAIAELLTPGRRLRSASQAVKSPLSSKTSRRTVQMKQQRNSQDYKSHDTPKPPRGTKRESESIDILIRQDLPPMKKQRKEPQLNNTISLEDKQVIMQHENNYRKSRTPKICQEGKELEVCDSEHDGSNTAESVEEAPKDQGHVNTFDEDERSSHKELDEAKSKIKELRRKLRASKSKERELGTKVTEMEDQARTLNVLPNSLRYGTVESLQKIILQKDQYIKKIVEELNDKRGLGTFTKSLPNSQPQVGKLSIKSGFEEAYSEIQQIIYRHNIQKPIMLPPLEQYEEFRNLLCASLGIELLDVKEAQLCLSNLSLQAIIRLGTSSALRKWVFESDFPKIGSVSDLLTSYRENLAKLGSKPKILSSKLWLLIIPADGCIALRNLDLSAHHSIINSDKFQKYIIPKRARKLARRLSCVLAPLFMGITKRPDHLDTEGFATWGHKRKEHEERKYRLINMFAGALKLKADSVLHSCNYKMFIYPPNTPFKNRTMNVENVEEIRLNGNFTDRVVEVCLQPAVFSYDKEDSKQDATKSVTDMIVTSQNFSRGGNWQEKGHLLIPAVVILRDEEPVCCNEHEEETESNTSTLTCITAEDNE